MFENMLTHCTGCLKKWDLFFAQYLNQIKHKYAGYIFDLKGGNHSSALSRVQKQFCTISESQPRYKQNNIGYQISRI